MKRPPQIQIMIAWKHMKSVVNSGVGGGGSELGLLGYRWIGHWEGCHAGR